MTESMMAYYGLDCAVCPAHLACKNNDDELRKKQAAEWGSPEYQITAAEINCVGCKVDAEPKFKFCAGCTIKSCASERGVETCAHCEDYGCDILEKWLTQAGDGLRQKLDNMRLAL
ncbi:MAG: DUF3795 domain-containing protein [Candidatus Thorarchaeota archaeon]|nr:DUF3795 domain-containing protein [Candidatus Thorarchaeota archaeon]